jgi:hypothetical protein
MSLAFPHLFPKGSSLPKIHTFWMDLSQPHTTPLTLSLGLSITESHSSLSPSLRAAPMAAEHLMTLFSLISREKGVRGQQPD